MPSLAEDPWVSQQAITHDVTVIADTIIAVDATYYIQQFLDNTPFHEPLLPALGGLTGIQYHIEKDLDEWVNHKVTPFFIFDGQSIIGQDDVSVLRGLKAIEKTDQAWELYFTGQAENAVTAFGANGGAFRPQTLYPLLQSILKQRKLHFLVPPYNAAAQIAYFDMIESDQCSALMGSQELLLYPIKDHVIKSIDWESKTVTSVSKKQVIRTLGVSEATFIDALLMTGTSFLSRFPPLQNTNVTPRQPPTVMDAINMLRASDKNMATCCASFSDMLQGQDSMWLDKYRKARMAVNHFIYIAESGAVQVNDFEKLTKDNHEYLGLQLPAELFHYLNTGLITARMLSWISHCKIVVLPTLDGVSSDEYKKLISTQVSPIKEMTLGLLIPRLNRGIQHRDVIMKVWYDDKFEHQLNHINIQPSPTGRALSWGLTEAAVKSLSTQPKSGSIAFEISALKNPDFVKKTFNKEKIKGGLEPADAIISISLWKFLHLRNYANDAHELTSWGNALSNALAALEATVKQNPEVPGLCEAVLLAMELVRFDLLNGKNKHEELHGLPMNGTEDDKVSLLLISRCATLLKLRHEANGYTGPLSKNLLAFHSLTSAVRDADRDLLEAVVASTFMFGNAKRERDDCWEIGHRLPFLNDPDVALGIAVKTLLDELVVDEPAEARAERKKSFPNKYVPYATHFVQDLEICYAFFEAVYVGVKSLDKEVSPSDKATWDKAHKYLQPRK